MQPRRGSPKLYPRVRQGAVDFITWLWPVMPRWLKVWAFLNDGDD